jgi:hypothetical protein
MDADVMPRFIDAADWTTAKSGDPPAPAATEAGG